MHPEDTLEAIGLAWLLAACTPTRQTQPAEPPARTSDGSPEAMVAALLGGAPQPRVDPAEIEKAPLGSKDNPVRVGGPGGERAYLSRLHCETGKTPKFERIGSFGVGPWGYILDGYSVNCDKKESVVFMDMYHSQHQEDRAVPGFTIDPARH